MAEHHRKIKKKKKKLTVLLLVLASLVIYSSLCIWYFEQVFYDVRILKEVQIPFVEKDPIVYLFSVSLFADSIIFSLLLAKWLSFDSWSGLYLMTFRELELFFWEVNSLIQTLRSLNFKKLLRITDFSRSFKDIPID